MTALMDDTVAPPGSEAAAALVGLSAGLTQVADLKLPVVSGKIAYAGRRTEPVLVGELGRAVQGRVAASLSALAQWQGLIRDAAKALDELLLEGLLPARRLATQGQGLCEHGLGLMALSPLTHAQGRAEWDAGIRIIDQAGWLWREAALRTASRLWTLGGRFPPGRDGVDGALDDVRRFFGSWRSSLIDGLTLVKMADPARLARDADDYLAGAGATLGGMWSAVTSTTWDRALASLDLTGLARDTSGWLGGQLVLPPGLKTGALMALGTKGLRWLPPTHTIIEFGDAGVPLGHTAIDLTTGRTIKYVITQEDVGTTDLVHRVSLLDDNFQDHGIGWLKPAEGEAYRGYLGVDEGTGAYRSASTYRLSELLKLDVVPDIRLVHTDLGVASLQAHAPGVALPLSQLHPLDVQRMAVLDYASAQADRHALNIRSTLDGRPAAIDNGLSFTDPQIREPGSLLEQRQIVSDFVSSQYGQPLHPSIVSTLRTVTDDQVAAVLRQTHLPDESIDGVLARLREMSGRGMITGDAWPAKIQDARFTTHPDWVER